MEELGADAAIICSSDVMKEVGEYERTVTACTNGLVKPVVQSYLGNLRELLSDDGGLTNLELAGKLPVNILMSGPAGGVQGVADVVTRNTPYKYLMTFDIGGTSTDCALIYQGKPQLRRETVVCDLTVHSPAVNIAAVRAGGVVTVDASPDIEIPRLSASSSQLPPADAKISKKNIIISGQQIEGTLWDRKELARAGVRVNGPCIITKMDSNTLILPCFYGEIDAIGNILIRPDEEAVQEPPKDQSPATAHEIVNFTPLIPTLVASALASTRSEMDTLMLQL
ncbi:hypothetical protein N8T08_006146 [Aspergillus melleus]|uniref:Uncharacterized protein n=1 Tax=Aspergillus melleus TaxID=138277 RepID=A0ACC3B0U3_9EURO|nr:hypothetical protein N8T08_006146 [Aspergillus melleus]